MPRRGLSLEVRVSPYNTVCVGGDLPRSARSVATALTPGATSTEGDRLGGLPALPLVSTKERPVVLPVCQAVSKVQRIASKAPSAVAGCSGSMAAREDAQREALALSFVSLAKAVRGDSVVLKSMVGFSTEQLAFLFKDPRSENAKKAFEWLAQMASVLSGFRSPARLPGLRWCSGFLRGAG